MKQFMKYLHFSKNITTIVLLVVFVGTYNNVFIVSVNGLTDATGPTELTPDEIAIKKCSLLSSNCGLCTREEECGFCVTYLRSGDGTSKYDVRLCLAVNTTTELPMTGEKCDSWRMNTCPCPNNCNDHGTCGGDGICECNYAWTGEDCSSKRPSLVKPGVIISIAIGTAFLGAAVVVSIQLFGGGARCLDRKGPEHDRLKEEKERLTSKGNAPDGEDIENVNDTKGETLNPLSMESDEKKKT